MTSGPRSWLKPIAAPAHIEAQFVGWRKYPAPRVGFVELAGQRLSAPVPRRGVADVRRRRTIDDQLVLSQRFWPAVPSRPPRFTTAPWCATTGNDQSSEFTHCRPSAGCRKLLRANALAQLQLSTFDIKFLSSAVVCLTNILSRRWTSILNQVRSSRRRLTTAFTKNPAVPQSGIGRIIPPHIGNETQAAVPQREPC